MKARKEKVDFETLSVDISKEDYQGNKLYTYWFSTEELINLDNLIIEKKVSIPETLEEYKELNGFSDKNILDMLMKK